MSANPSDLLAKLDRLVDLHGGSLRACGRPVSFSCRPSWILAAYTPPTVVASNLEAVRVVAVG